MFQAREGGWLGVVLALVSWMFLAPAGVVAQDDFDPAGPVQVVPARGPWTTATLARSLADIELMLTVDRDVDQAALWIETARKDALIEGVLQQDAGLRVEFERVATLIERARTPDQSGLREQLRLALVGFKAEELIDQLGGRAIEPLEQLVDEIVDMDPGANGDPLFWLFNQEPVRAMSFVAEREAQGRPLPAYRVMRAFRGSSNLEKLFLPVPYRAPRLRSPEFPDLWARYLTDPHWESRADRLAYLSSLGGQLVFLAQREALTDELRTAIVEVLRRQAPLARFVKDVLAQHEALPDLRPVYEALIDIDDVALRRLVAQRLGDLPVGDALLSLVDDPDSEVRWHVARALGRHQVRLVPFDKSGARTGGDWDWYVPMRGEREIATLARLARDPDPSVREAAVLSIGDGRAEAMPVEVLIGLASDADAGVREELALSIKLDDASLAPVLLALCDTDDEHVLHAVDVRLENADWGEDAEALLPVLHRRRAHPTYPLGFNLDVSPSSRLASRLRRSWVGARELARWALESGDSGWLSAIFKVEPHSGVGLFELESEELVRVIPMLAEAEPNWFWALTNSASKEQPTAWVDACRRLTGQADASMLVRFMAAQALLGEDGRDCADALIDVLADEGFMAWVDGDERGYSVTLGSVIRRSPPAVLDRTRSRLLTETRLDDELLLEILADSSSSSRPFSPAFAADVLDRWYDPDVGGLGVVNLALARAAEIEPGRLDPSVLIRAVRQPTYVHSAVRAMGRIRDPVFLPTLGECLDPSWLPDSAQPESVAQLAAMSLSSFLTDEAAAVLLDGAARTASPAMRDVCLAAVGVIGDYQDSVANWERRVSVRAMRDEAVRELAEMLTDDSWEVRLQAVRGLGTLRAAEHIPDLIRLLRDDESSVRDAAIEALDKINAETAPASPSDTDGH